VDPIAQRVARRFRAKSIGDPKRLLSEFERVVEYMAELEPLVPRMREAQRAVEDDPSLEYKAHKGQVTGDLAELGKLWGKQIAHFRLQPSFALSRAHQTDGADLFLAILQHYDVPKKVRRVIERGAKFFSKTRTRKPKDPQAIDNYVKTLKTYRDFLEAAESALLSGTFRGEGAATRLPAGKFTAVNTGGFSDEVMANCVDAIEKVSRLLTAKGLGRICYGDVLIANTVGRSSRVLAFYQKPSDEMFVRANLRGKKGTAVEVIIHELAHRLHFKFLKSKDRDIQQIYLRLLGDDRKLTQEALDDPVNKPKVGDTLTSKGKTYEVVGVGYRRGLVVELQRTDDPKRKASVSMAGWLQMKGFVSEAGAFVSLYARENSQENFAEMVTHYVLGTLPDDQVEMLEAVLG
jgi:hypothetical protein